MRLKCKVVEEDKVEEAVKAVEVEEA